MKPSLALFFRAAAVLLCLGLTLRLALRRPRVPGSGEPALRDALNEAPADLAEVHARMSGLGADHCALCHIPRRDAPRGRSWTSPEELPEEGRRAGPRPPPSEVCLSCHDGALAPLTDGSGRQHPIGLDYRSVWRSRPNEFNPPDGNPAIRLDQGRVGCVSCHHMHGPAGPSGRLGIIESSCESCHRR